MTSLIINAGAKVVLRWKVNTFLKMDKGGNSLLKEGRVLGKKKMFQKRDSPN